LSLRYSGKVQFVSVYIDEAHPTDGWSLPINKEEGVCFRRPKTIEDRVKIAKVSKEKFPSSFPTMVDLMDNNANKAFAAIPERLYGIVNDKIAFKGGPGPFEYDVDVLEEWLDTNFQ